MFVHKLRSFLSILGILIGTASVVAMVSSGELATQQALAQFKVLGTDILSFSLNAADPMSNVADPLMTVDKIYKLRETIPAITHIAPYTIMYNQAVFNGQSFQFAIIGSTQSLADVIHINLLTGRFISDLDRYAKYCVLGNGVAQSFSLPPQQLIGQQVQIGMDFYTVIGVAAAWPQSTFFNADINNSIITPISTSLASDKYNLIDNVIMQLEANSDIDYVESKITHQIIPINDSGDTLSFRSAKALIESMTAQHRIFTWLLGLIGSTSLLVGGVGVMNIMLVSVLERRQEIGIRLAIGARRRDIQWLFLSEAIVLSITGGFIGIILGIIVSFIVAEFAHWQFVILIWPALVGFIVSVCVGVFSGFYPALQASRLDPIQTLRAE